MKDFLSTLNGYNDQKPSSAVHDGMISYANYVCQSRSIPSVCDGLKTSQRIALWCSDRYYSGKKVKTAGLAGQAAASNLYVHGDLGGTISMMAGKFVNNMPYFKGHGSFGTLCEPRAFGAPRYTSVSIPNNIKKIMFESSDIWNMIPSVDGDNEMCETFLPMIPTVLLNGSSGMAVGYSTDILPHKLDDIIKNTIDVINGKKIPNINPYFENFDLDITQIDDSLSYIVNGKVEIQNTTTVEIKSIPPNMTIGKLRARLVDLIESGDITSFDDRVTDKFSVVVKMTRQNLNGKTPQDLIRLFKITSRMTERLVTVGTNGLIRTYSSHQELIEDWIDWRFPKIKQQLEFTRSKDNDRLEFLRDVVKCFKADLPSKLPSFKTRKELTDFISSICSIPRPQIVEFATYRWTNEYYEKIESEIESLEEGISILDEIILNEKEQKRIFIKDIKQLKRV